MKNSNENNIALTAMVYRTDNWYGTRIRYFIDGFATKSEAKKSQTMLKKYIKSELLRSSDSITGFEIGVLADMKTYQYVSLGPSWACTNVKVNLEYFRDFSEKENIRLQENRKYRATLGTRTKRSPKLRSLKKSRR